MQAVIYNNNRKLRPTEWEKLTLNRGLFYGESPFTTLKLSEGTYEGLELHLKRLANSTYFLWNIDFTDFKQEIMNGLKELYESSGDFYIRITFIKALDEVVDFIIYKKPYKSEEGEISLKISKLKRGDTILPSFLKVGNYLEYSLELRKSNCTELIYFNYRGELLECGTSNIFLVKGNIISTPLLMPGVLDGVTRRLLLYFLMTTDFEVKECALELDDLEGSDEIWLTNGLKGIRAANSLGNRELSNKIFLKINEKFKEFVRDYGQA